MPILPRFPPEYAALAEAIRAALSDDLRLPPWRGAVNRFTGHCYVASEAFYHLAGSGAAGWKPVRLAHEGSTHWWLRDSRGQIVDLTSEQFSSPVPYERGVGGGFLTREPSRRAQILIERVRMAQKAQASL
jgi:hypothetical protein